MNVVIVNCFDTYEHRVDILREVLKDEGHQVKVLSSDFRHFEKVKRTEPKDGFMFFETKPYYKNMSIQRMYSHADISRRIFTYVEENINTIDILWVLIPPNSLTKDAARIKKKYPQIKLILDVIDLWPETMPVGKIKKLFPFTCWRRLRDDNLRVADYIVTECNLYREKLRDILKDLKVQTLYLARPYLEYNPDLRLPEDKISLCYLGSINNIIAIDVICDILNKLKVVRPVELHVIGDGEKRPEFLAEVEKTGAEVVYHGKIYDRSEKQKVFDSCHFGLNIMKESVCVGFTMKSIDYLEFGLPIINNIQGDTWDIVEKYNLGFNVSSGLDAVLVDYDGKRIAARKYFEDNLTKEKFGEVVGHVIQSIEVNI